LRMIVRTKNKIDNLEAKKRSKKKKTCCDEFRL
jgi:hypothetical protein